MGKHKFNAGAICEYCGIASSVLNERRLDGKLPNCADAPEHEGFYVLRNTTTTISNSNY